MSTTREQLEIEQMRIDSALATKRKPMSEPDPVDMLAVWEYYCDYFDEGEKLPCEGAVDKRQYVVDEMTAFCDKWWEYAHAFLGFDDSYDWEFLPPFLSTLPTHDVSQITMEQITEALIAVMDSFNRIAKTPEASV